eukprot:15778-Heterococcus_DN1.PRE.2
MCYAVECANCECGGAMQQRACPECGAPMGGMSHTLAAGNVQRWCRVTANNSKRLASSSKACSKGKKLGLQREDYVLLRPLNSSSSSSSSGIVRMHPKIAMNCFMQVHSLLYYIWVRRDATMRTGIGVFMRVGFALTSTQFASQQCSNEQHTNSSSAAAKQTRRYKTSKSCCWLCVLSATQHGQHAVVIFDVDTAAQACMPLRCRGDLACTHATASRLATIAASARSCWCCRFEH